MAITLQKLSSIYCFYGFLFDSMHLFNLAGKIAWLSSNKQVNYQLSETNNY